MLFRRLRVALLPADALGERGRLAKLTVEVLGVALALSAVVRLRGLPDHDALMRLIVVAMTVWVGLVALHTRPGWTLRVGHLFVGSLILLAGAMGAIGGDTAELALVVVPVVPPLATLLLSLYGGLAWTLVSLGLILLISKGVFLGLLGSGMGAMHLPQLVGSMGGVDGAFRGGTAALVGTFAFCVAALFEADRRAQQRSLRALHAEAQAASVAKGRLLSTMSHEVRTSLDGVLGASQLLESTPLGLEQRRLVGMMLAAGAGLDASLGNVLDLPKLQRGHLPLNEASVDLRRLVSEVEQASQPRAETKGLRLTMRIDDDVPEAVCVDSRRLRHVLLNLTTNAVKFTERGSVQVRVSREHDFPHEEDEVVLLFAVHDTGVGMDVGQVRRLLSVDAPTYDGLPQLNDGMGLGLPMVKQLVHAMGGDLCIRSEPERGSTFQVRLPLRPSDLPVRSSVRLFDCAGVDDLSLRVLLVEDDPVSREVGLHLLTLLGVQVSVANDGVEAVERATAGSFDLILMDIQMPRMDGLQATRVLRKRWDVQVPILALTACAFVGDQEACLEAGMNGHIAKPARLNKLAAALQEWGRLDKQAALA